MSTLYNLEPQPTASAIIHTTLGEISIELFAKQTPLTCRNFLQLALDGYYDDTIFHRLVPGFILQGGDPTGTGNGGESIYDGGALSGDLDPWPMDQRQGKNAGPMGINFRDEFHSRLKFNRRGQLAMANDGRPDTNGSQFFFTLDKADELNGKNTLFGRVAGDTIYNLVKIGESEVDEATERPLYTVKIIRVEVVVNPFEDMKKRERVAPVAQRAQAKDKDKKKKRKGGKQLLSFGEEEGEEELPMVKKPKFDTRIVMNDDTEDMPETVPKPKTKKKDQHKSATVAEKEGASTPEKDPEVMPSSARSPRAKKAARSPSPSPIRSPEPEVPEKSALVKANEELAALKASMRRTVHDEKPVEKASKSALEALIPETSTRARKRRPGGNTTLSKDEEQALKKLRAFQAKLDQAGPAREALEIPEPEEANEARAATDSAQDEETELCDLHFIANCQSCTAWDKQGQDEGDDEGWMSHKLSFAADKLGKDLKYRKKAEEELVVIDPRERARTFKEEKKAEREARSGRTGRAWDQQKNAEMARTASLAGRGAR